MARPKKPTGESRPHRVQFRLTDAEMGQLRLEATGAEMDPNECARSKATGAPATRREARAGSGRPAPELFPFEVRQDLRRIGVNINQIARKLNTLHEHEPEELKAASRELAALLRLMRAAITETVH